MRPMLLSFGTMEKAISVSLHGPGLYNSFDTEYGIPLEIRVIPFLTIFLVCLYKGMTSPINATAHKAVSVSST